MNNDENSTELNELENNESGSEKTERTFSEEEVQKLIKDRLARSKQSYSTLEKELATFKEDSGKELATYRDILEKDVEAKTKNLPESVISLLDKLTTIEKLEWLSNPDNLGQVERKPIPKTPDGDNVDKPPKQPEPSLRF